MSDPKVDRARSRLQTMTNTALTNIAERYGVDMTQGGRVVGKKHKIARLMATPGIIEEYGVTPEK